MAPSATVSTTNGTSNGKHHDLKTTIPKAKNGTSNGDSEPHLTSADVIRLEHEHGAHK
jgi:hypothetical protein